MLRRSLLATAFSVTASLATAQVPAGGEFRVNTQTMDGQYDPWTAVAPNGDFVVVWTSRVALLDYDVMGQRYTSDGARIGGEFRANTYTPGAQRSASVAVNGHGDFVIVWHDHAQNRMVARRYHRSGAPLGAEFRVDNATSAIRPVVAADQAGNFIVAWSGFPGDGSSSGVRFQRVSAAGALLGADFLVNTYTTGAQFLPAIGMAPSGEFVVAWYGEHSGDSGEGIVARRFAADGSPRGEDFLVNTYTTGRQTVPSAAMDRRGNFVIAWQSEGIDGGYYGVAARQFSASGGPIGDEFVVNTSTAGPEGGPAARAADAGSFVVVWHGIDANSRGVFGQRFYVGATPRGVEFRISSYTLDAQWNPRIALDPTGNIVVAWQSIYQDGSDRGIYAQRYGAVFPAGLRLDPGNAVLEPGETAQVRPSWRNASGASQALTAALVGFDGPLPGGVPSVTDGNGSYGTIGNGATAECVDCYTVAIGNPSPRPGVHWDGKVLELLQPDVQGQEKLWTLHVGRSFDDVPATSPFYTFVERLLHHGVTGGCAPTTYCPSAQASREQMAVFVLVAKEGTGYLPPPCTTPVFGDVPASSPFCRWVEELARRGVVGGCGGGNYCPAAGVSRDQMAVFVVRTLDPTLNPPACVPPNVFADVPETSPFCRWVEELANRSIVTGCGGGNYCPASPVTREQMGVFLAVTFGLTLY